jgi:hypothetical protein
MLATTVSSCSGGAHKLDDGVIRIGRRAIAAADIAHWSRISRHGTALSGQLAERDTTTRQRAIRFLIWSVWVNGEAARHRAGVSDAAVSRALATQQAGFPSKSEFEGFLKENGETTADARLELQTDLAAAALERIAWTGRTQISRAEVAGYYARHKLEFTRDETRYFNIINALPFAAAQRVVRRARSAGAFPRRHLQEVLTHDHMLHTTRGKRRIERAIFAARPGAPEGPVELFGAYSVFEVTRIAPRALRPLAAVTGRIEARLSKQMRRHAFTRFTRRWLSTWKAKTSCAPDYVIDMCRQSAETPELEHALENAQGAAEAAADVSGGPYGGSG